MLRHVSITRSSSGSCLFLAKITLLKTFTALFSNNSLMMWQHAVLCSVVRSAPAGALLTTLDLHNTTCCHIIKLLLENQAVNVFNNVNLARNRQLPDDDRMIETCRSIFKSCNINNLSVCIGWCADQVTLRSARCNGKDPSNMSQGLKNFPYCTETACNDATYQFCAVR